MAWIFSKAKRTAKYSNSNGRKKKLDNSNIRRNIGILSSTDLNRKLI